MVVLRGDNTMTNHGFVLDAGEQFQVITTTRKIVVPTQYKTLGAVGDHLSEDITLRCPKMIDNHPVKNCKAYVTWKTPRGTVGRTDIWITEESDEDDYLHLHWVLSADVTDSAGYLEFSLHFEDKDKDGNLLYKWSTAINKECEILESIRFSSGGGGDDGGGDDDYTPTVPEGYVKPSGTLDITDNGEHDVFGYAVANVAVPVPTLHPITVKENGEYIPDDGYGYSRVVVDVTSYGELQAKELEITKNDEYTITPDEDFGGLSEVKLNVNVTQNLQVKGVTVKNNTAMVIKPDDGYDGLLQVVISTEVEEVKNSVIVFTNSAMTDEILTGGTYSDGTE